MTGPKFIVLTLCITFGCSSVFSFQDSKTLLGWKTNLALLPFIGGSFVLQVSADTPQEETLSPKAIKGKKLLDDLTESLGELKKALEEKTDIEQDTLDKVMKIKDDFKDLQEEPGELPKEMLSVIRQKIFESFRLVMQSFNLDKHVKPRKGAEPDKETAESSTETEPKKAEESGKREEIQKPEESAKTEEESKKTAETQKQKETKKSKKSAKSKKSKTPKAKVPETTVESEEPIMEPIGAENVDNQVYQNVESKERRVNEEL